MDKNIKEGLEREFDKSLTKKMQGFPYIEGQTVIQRLNDVLGNDGWKFSVDNTDRDSDFLLVWGTLSVMGNDEEWVSKSQVGSDGVTYKSGAEHLPENVVDLGNNWKAATTDCIKKCATLFGVALYLYGAVEEHEDPDEAFSAILAQVQKAEEATSAFTDISKYRTKQWGHDVLTSLDVAELKGYYKQLRADYKPLKKAHEERKEAATLIKQAETN